MVGRQHRELKLQSVRGVNIERVEMIVRVFRYLDVECLWQRLARLITSSKTEFTYNVVFDTVDLGIQESQLGYTVIGSCLSCD